MKPTLTKKRRPPIKAKRGGLYFNEPKLNLQTIHTGSELLNCVVSGGWPLARISNIVGDKSTGKTLLAIEAIANFFRQYESGKARYCETEAAFDDEYAAGLGVDMGRVSRAECATVEELFDDMVSFIDEVGEGGQGLYIVDSLDALSDKAETERRFDEATYGATKPKQMGQLFRRLVKPLKRSNVGVIIISQVRDAIGVTFGQKHTRSGGRALDFYASIIVWLAHVGQIKKTRNKLTRAVGVSIKAKCTKCKIGPPFRECEFDILFGFGIDDVGSSLSFLKDAGELGKLGIGTTDAAVAAYQRRWQDAGDEERGHIEEELAEVVRKVWHDVERTFMPARGKYVRSTAREDDE